MIKTDTYKRLLFLLLCAVVMTAGCASYAPQPVDQVAFRERAHTQSNNNLTVTAAVPSAEETKTLFGVPLYKKDIQPIWLQIQNNNNEHVFFLPVGTDPEYYAPLEVSYMNHRWLQGENNDNMDRDFLERGIGLYVAPRSVSSGFVFTNLDEGTKSFNVDIVTAEFKPTRFTFFMPVPGLRADHHEVNFATLYSKNQLEIHGERSLRRALETLPCCTTNKDGTEQGDPLNLVIIGTTQDVYQAFLRADWDETETIYGGSTFKTGMSFLFGKKYRYSPISALYVYDRPQDAALQKARHSIHLRNHLRLWMTPMRLGDKPVWIGQISRDIGVRFTTKTITTHKIDPDVDEARIYLLQDLIYSQTLAKYAYVKGVGAASMYTPRKNLTGDPYFTDGHRAVFWLSSDPVAVDEIKFIDWEKPIRR